MVSQKVRVFSLKKLFLKRFTVGSTTRTLIIDKTDHSAFTAITIAKSNSTEFVLLPVVFILSKLYEF